MTKKILYTIVALIVESIIYGGGMFILIATVKSLSGVNAFNKELLLSCIITWFILDSIIAKIKETFEWFSKTIDEEEGN